MADLLTWYAQKEAWILGALRSLNEEIVATEDAVKYERLAGLVRSTKVYASPQNPLAFSVLAASSGSVPLPRRLPLGAAANTRLIALDVPSGWTTAIETTFGGRVRLEDSYLVANTDLSAIASGTVRLRTTNADGRLQIVETFAVDVAGPSAPIITTAATASVPENTAFEAILAADQPVTWTKTGGQDAAQFDLIGATLRLGARDFEAPTDVGANNTYQVQVSARSVETGDVSSRTITVTVTDVSETQPGGGPNSRADHTLPANAYLVALMAA